MNAAPPRPASAGHHLLAFLLAALGGALGILGAAVQEIRSGGGLLLPFLGAPIIEEVLKPSGLYIVLIRWPQVLTSQLYTALLSFLAGLSFGLIESLIYVTLYNPEHSGSFLLYRFTLPVFMHAAASFLVGLGINQGLMSWVRGEASLPWGSLRFFVAGMVLHAFFNFTVAILAVAGVLEVD